VIPETSTGTDESVVLLLPSWPYRFHPQHFTPPPDTRAQVCSPPAETCVYVTAPADAGGANPTGIRADPTSKVITTSILDLIPSSV
jgi:hypothetical protein